MDQSDVVIERYTYDGFDRTTREQKFSTTGALQLDKTQTFDPFDRTVSQTTAITGKPTKSLRFTYLGMSDQVAVEEEKNTAGAWAVAKNYAYGPDGSKLQLTNTPVNDTTKNETQYYGTNPHGDVENLTLADGSAKSTYRYTAYGMPDKKGTTGEDAYSTSTDAPTRMAEDLEADNPYRFSGKRIHGGTGTYDIGFRDYNPGINRFLTRDFYQGALNDLALGTDPWSTNRYAYAGGNPIGLIDLDGHEPRPWHEKGKGFDDFDAQTIWAYGAGADEAASVGYAAKVLSETDVSIPDSSKFDMQCSGGPVPCYLVTPPDAVDTAEERKAYGEGYFGCWSATIKCATFLAATTLGPLAAAKVLARVASVLRGTSLATGAATKTGTLSVTAANASASELRAAKHMASLGRNVELRDPLGTRGTATSDLLVDGVQYDVYTPTSSNPNNIIRAIAKKGSQVQGGGVVLDLSQTSVTRADLGDIMARVANSTSRVSDVVVLP